MPTVEELELLKKSAVVEIQTDLIAAVATDTAAAVAAKDAAETAETNSASSASASATSASEAEAAKDAVEAIADFTDGNIYEGNGTGIIAVSKKRFFGDSFLQQTGFVGEVINGVTPTSDAVFDNIYTLSGTQIPSNSESYLEIEVDRFGTRTTNTQDNIFAFYVDSQNYVMFKILGGSSGNAYIKVIEVLAGVEYQRFIINAGVPSFYSGRSVFKIYGQPTNSAFTFYSVDFSSEQEFPSFASSVVNKQNITAIAFKSNSFAPWKGFKLRSQGQIIG
jgi:hypothetical protein